MITSDPGEIMPTAIAVLNQKGGVGKSTTTLNLAAMLASRGKRVLVIDVDPQGTTTIAAAGTVQHGTAEVLGYGREEEDVAGLAERLPVRSPSYNFDIVGADFDRLNHQEIALTSSPMLMVRFLEFVEALAGRYDFVLFDCPPALRSLTTATLYAADGVLLVVEPSKESIDGLGKLLSYLAGLKRLLQREPTIIGAVITKADPRERLVNDVKAVLDDSGRVPWTQLIYNTIGFKDAYAESQPLAAIAKTPAHLRAVHDIGELADRILAMPVPAAV